MTASRLATVAPGRRRERAADFGAVVVAESVAAKLLHGWLQNRHQTLVPMTLNLRVLTPEQRLVVTDALAALLLAGRPRADALEAAPALRPWLSGLGGDAPVLAAFEAALNDPPPIDRILERAIKLDLAVYVYVTAIIASDPRYQASVLLADVVQARFELSHAVARSAIRRYRRS